jgi:hypothetical protein
MQNEIWHFEEIIIELYFKNREYQKKIKELQIDRAQIPEEIGNPEFSSERYLEGQGMI